MRNAKWFAMVAAFGLALTLSACGDEEGRACEIDDDCLDTEICDVDCDGGICITPCTSDTQCTDGDVCAAAAGTCAQHCAAPGGAACTEDKNCDENACQICAGGECTSKCDETQECDGAGNCVAATCTDETFNVCYVNDAWCDSGSCTPLEVGTCAGAANKKTPANANAPMIYAVEANAAGCAENDQTHCAGGVGCAWNVFFWDPQPDVDAEYSDVKYVTAAGTAKAIGFVEEGSTDGKFGSVIAWTCVGFNPEAVLIQDNAGNQSNAFCF